MTGHSTEWTALADLALDLQGGALPHGWILLSASRSARLFKVGADVVVKRVNVVAFGAHVAPLARVRLEGSAPRYLGPWVPETLHCDPARGVLVRRFADGQMLSRLQGDRTDVAALARDLAHFLEHAFNSPGPAGDLRPLAVMCAARLRRSGCDPDVVDAVVKRIVAGAGSSHGDLSPANIVFDGRRVALIDAETLDRGSVAWDLGHVLALSDALGIHAARWRRDVLRHLQLPDGIVADADFIARCLGLQSRGTNHRQHSHD